MTGMRIALLGFAALAGASPALAQEKADKPFRLHQALDLPDWVKLTGSVRPRYEHLADPFVAGRTKDDQFISMQSTLQLELSNKDLVLGGELYDSRNIDDNGGGGAASEINTLEIVQAYVAWRPKNLVQDGSKAEVLAGRFTMDVGSRRLIARSNYRNLLQGFQGVHANWTGKSGLGVTAFYASPVIRAPSDAASALDNDVEFDEAADDTHFSGVFVQAPLSGGINADLYVYHLDENDEPGLATRNRDLTTVGIRLKKPAKAKTFDFDGEYATQTGHTRATTSAADVTNLDHDAHYVHLEGGYTFDAPWSPRVSLHYDFGTGDKSPTDLKDERFDSLFGDRTFELGPTGIFGAIQRFNVSSPGIRLELKPTKKLDVMGMLRKVDLDQKRDAFGSTAVRDAAGASGKDVGTQAEVRVRYQLIPDSVRLEGGVAGLFRGDFLKRAPNATKLGDSIYTYTQLVWTF